MSNRARKILIVDDNPDIHADFISVLTNQSAPCEDELDALTDALLRDRSGTSESNMPSTKPKAEAPTFELTCVSQGQDGIDAVKQALQNRIPFEMAFVDMRMPPGIDGLETIEGMWRLDPNLQITICTAFSDHEWSDITDRLGWNENFLILKKPFDPIEAIQIAHSLTQKRRATLAAQAHADRLRSSIDRLQSEAQQRQRSEERLRHQTLHDHLTGLPNRTLLIERIEHCLGIAKRDPSTTFAVLFLDLDNFKYVNDTMGHRVGDDLLIAVAQRINDGLESIPSTIRPHDCVAGRVGGDEFIILLQGIKNTETVVPIGDHLRRHVCQSIQLLEREHFVSVSIGAATANGDSMSTETVLHQADTALLRSKGLGKGMTTLFDEDMFEETSRRELMENELAFAIDRRQFEMNYQPIIDLKNGEIVGFEALIRWSHPELGQVPPFEFLKIAEENGLIIEIGKWTVRESLLQLGRWCEKYRHCENLTMSVNISPRQFTDPDLSDLIRSAVKDARIQPQQVSLEVTETTVAENITDARAQLNALRASGYRVDLDDFGTGYSSLSYLHELPIDAVKIDRSFVKRLDLSGDAANTIQAVVTLAHNRGLIVIAEGIERFDQMIQLQALDAERGQGYYFSRPVNVQTAEENFLRQQRVWHNAA